MIGPSPSFGGKPKRAAASGAVLQAVSEADLTPSEAVQFMGLIYSFHCTLEITELEAQQVALEAPRF